MTHVFRLFEHKNGIFVRFFQQDELNEQHEQDELNERDEPNEREEQDDLNGRVRSVHKKRGWPMWSPS